MAKKRKKQQQEKARRRRAKRDAKRRARQKTSPDTRSGASKLALEPADPSLCYPPVYISAEGRVVPDPLALLGIEEADPEAVHRAWREQLLLHPPEQNPERAAALTAARERLLDPEALVERELGVLHVPNPEAFGLGADEEPIDRKAAVRSRLMAQAALYAMVEEALLSS